MSALEIPTTTPAGGGGLFDAYALLRDEKSSGTDGGSFASGAWRTRDLNTEVFDVGGIVSISSNQFTLQAGSYFIKARSPVAGAGGEIAYHRIKIRNVTDSTDDILGQNHYSNPGTFEVAFAMLAGRITIAGAKTFELQHRLHATPAGGTGFGQSVGGALGSATEIYAEVEIWREAA